MNKWIKYRSILQDFPLLFSPIILRFLLSENKFYYKLLASLYVNYFSVAIKLSPLSISSDCIRNQNKGFLHLIKIVTSKVPTSQHWWPQSETGQNIRSQVLMWYQLWLVRVMRNMKLRQGFGSNLARVNWCGCESPLCMLWICFIIIE